MNTLATLLSDPSSLAEVAAIRGEPVASLRRRLAKHAQTIAEADRARDEVASVERLSGALGLLRTARRRVPNVARAVLAEYRRMEAEEPVSHMPTVRDLLCTLVEAMTGDKAPLTPEDAEAVLDRLALAGTVPEVTSAPPKPATTKPPAAPTGRTSSAVVDCLREGPLTRDELYAALPECDKRGVCAVLVSLTRAGVVTKVGERYELAEEVTNGQQ